jgi:acetyl-CoA carboxylase biotin carboxyl carrier protein
MKPKEIQELIDFVANSGLAEVNIETEQFKLNIKKYPDVMKSEAPVYSMPTLAQAPQQVQQIQAPVANTAPKAETPKVETPAASNLITIKSPMIGHSTVQQVQINRCLSM